MCATPSTTSCTRSPSGNTLDPLALDVGRDDYYGHSGNWFDLQDSPWLVFLNSQMRLALQLTGKGVVRSDIPGVDCSAACTSDWNGGTKVALSPTPAEGQRFVRWSGACTGSGACTVDLTQAASVDALFAPATFALRVATTGKGTVRGAQGTISCGTRCRSAVASYVPVKLTATAAKGWRLRSWSGACRGTKPACILPMGYRARRGRSSSSGGKDEGEANLAPTRAREPIGEARLPSGRLAALELAQLAHGPQRSARTSWS